MYVRDFHMQEICLEYLSEDPQQLSRHVNLLFQGQPENVLLLFARTTLASRSLILFGGATTVELVTDILLT